MEDFLQPDEIEELKSCGEEFTTNLPLENERKIFSTEEMQQVYLNDKIVNYFIS